MRTRRLALVWFCVLGLARGQQLPHEGPGHHRGHHKGHLHNHHGHQMMLRKAQVPARATVVDPAATASTLVPEVLVYVDKDRNAVQTATELVMVVPPRAQENKMVAASGASGASGRLHGVTYSPYRGDGTCKSAGEISSDLKQLQGTVSLIRIYGVDCDQVNTVMPAVVGIGVKIFLGLFNLDSLDTDIQTLVDGVENNGGWSHVDTVSVGNELVNNGQATPQQIIQAVTSTRSSLRSAGYHGPVVTVDTFIAAQKHPEICDASDYCAINTHPFFDPTCQPDGAGDFVVRMVAKTRSRLADPNKRVVVTESGWPSQGTANGVAVPSKENQAIATESILSVYGSMNPSNLIMFTAFDDPWKRAEPATFYAEQFWGMYSQ